MPKVTVQEGNQHKDMVQEGNQRKDMVQMDASYIQGNVTKSIK